MAMLMHTGNYVEAMNSDPATPEEAIAYLESATALIESVDGWKVTPELQMCLDQRSTPISMITLPKEFADFHDDWAELWQCGRDAGFIEHADFRSIRALARALATSSPRRQYYLQYLGEFFEDAKQGKCRKLPTFHDLELHYQYHLYEMDHEDIGVAVDKSFKEWCSSDECHTFLDVMELAPAPETIA